MNDVQPVYSKAPLEEILEEDVNEKSLDVKDLQDKSESERMTPEKKKIFIALLLSIGMTQTLYMNIATFLPLHIDDTFNYNKDPADQPINSLLVTVIVSMFEVAYIISSPLVGSTLKPIGRKNFMVFGYFIIVIGTLGFGVLAYVPLDSPMLFVGLAIVLRFMQGFGDSCVSTAVYSLVTIEFPDKKEEYVGYCQSACGIGLMIGPVLGQLIYAVVKYEWTFYIFAIVMLLANVFVFSVLPKRLNKIQELVVVDEEGVESKSVVTAGPQITFSMFLLNLRCMITVCSAVIAMVFMMFFNGILSTHLNKSVGVSEDSVGFILAIGAFAYALSSPLVSIIFKNTPRRYVALLAFVLATVALFIFGPSHFLGFPPDSLAFLIPGLALLGIAIALIFVPLLTEIIASVQEAQGIDDNPVLNDKASAVFNAAYATGCVSGPIIGGILDDHYKAMPEYEHISFNMACDFMAFCAAGFTILYFLLNIVPYFFIKPKTYRQISIEDTQSDVVDIYEPTTASEMCKPMLEDGSGNMSNLKTMTGTMHESMDKMDESSQKMDTTFDPLSSFEETIKQK